VNTTPPHLAHRASRLAAALPPAAPDGAIAFDSGHASPAVLPDLRAAATSALGTHRAETLQYAPRPGLPEMRRWIAEHMRADGCAVTPDEILVTNGAKHAIELLCRLLLDEGDAIVVTAPTYFTAIPIFRSFGASFVEVPQDRDGLDVDALRDALEARARDGLPAPKFVYNVPDFHNPTGVSMSLERRRALVALASEHDLYIVEDSPYRSVRFDGESLPPLKGLDTDGRVFLVGTFAKLMAPGLRVGWVAAPAPIVARLVQLKADGGSCPLTQRIILEFAKDGGLDAHGARVRATYRANRDHMVAALARELPNATFDVPEGGYYVWLALPDGVDADAVAARARDEGVIVIPGSKFFARADVPHPSNLLRLAYSHASADEIDEGVRRLARAAAAVREAAPALAAR